MLVIIWDFGIINDYGHFLLKTWHVITLYGHISPDILNDPALQGRLEQVCEDKELQTKLDKTSDLLTELHQQQHTRLSQPPSGPTPWEVGTTEQELADKVQENLSDMISGHVPGPARVVSQEAVRDVIGSELVDQVLQ